MYRHIKKPALFKWGANSGPPRQRGPDSFTQRVMVTGFAVLALGSFSSGVLAQDMLPAPSLAGPCNDEIIVEHSPDFDWSSVSTADTYRIRVSTDEGFSSFDEAAADSSCVGDCWTAVIGSPGYSGFYLESGIYYWQARAGIKYKDEENKGKGGKWSSKCKFEINEKPGVLAQDMLPAPSLAGPCNDEIIVEHSPDFDWSSVSTADTYRILVSTDDGFSSFDEKAADSSCTGDCWTAVTGSPGYSRFNLKSRIYYWRARAGIKYKDEDNKGKGGEWSSTCKFEINEKPEFIEGSAVPNAVGDGASVRFTCVWGDHEKDALYDVKAKYGSTEVEFKPVEKSSDRVVFTKVVEVKGPGGYSVECQVSDKNTRELHTTEWKDADAGDLTDNAQPLPERPRLEIKKAENHISAGQDYTIQLMASDFDVDMVRIEVDWTGDGDQNDEQLSPTDEVMTFTHQYPTTGSVTWSATAYDANNHKSNMVQKWVGVSFPPETAEIAKQEIANKDSCDNSNKDKRNLIHDPIDTVTGAQILRHDLLSLRGVLPLSFTISYNSLLLAEGNLGRAWEHNGYDFTLRELPNDDVIINWSANQFNLFAKSGDAYKSPQSACHSDTLVKTANGFTLTRKGITYDFDELGRLLKLQNRQAQSLEFQRDAEGRLTQVTEPVSGISLSYAYNGDGLLTTVTDSLGRKVLLGYDGDRNLTTITDAAGRVTTYIYNEFGQTLTGTQDGQTLFSNTYANNRIVGQTDSSGNYSSLAFSGNQTTVTNRNNQSQTHQYDGEFFLQSSQDELNKTTSFGYANGKRTRVTNANGHTTSFAYDGKGNLTTLTDGTGSATQMAYDDQGNVLSISDALGTRATFVYDANNNVISKTDGLGNTTQYSYNGAGQVVTVTSPSGVITAYDYSKGLPVKVTTAGDSQALSYDAAGRLVSVTDAKGQTTTLAYDKVDRLVQVTDALSRTVSITYDNRDNVLTVTDASGVITNAYDANDNLMSQVDVLDRETRFEYDAEGRQIKVIDPKEQVTLKHYDAAGRLIEVTNADGKSKTFSYDAVGRLLSVTDVQGHTTQYARDAVGRLVKKTDALSHTTAMTYDSRGNLLTVKDANNNTTQYSYDAADNLVSKINALDQETRYEYDSDGRRVKIINAKNQVTQLAYDAKGRLVTVKDALGNTRQFSYDKDDVLLSLQNELGHITAFTYDAAGKRTGVTDANGHATQYAFDLLDNLTAITNAAGGVKQVSADAKGNILAVTNVLNKITGFVYDANDNLVSKTDVMGNKTSYAYDSDDQVVTVTSSNGTVTTFADNRPVKITDPQGHTQTLSYNAVGRLLTVTDAEERTTTYTYDAVNRLVAVKDALNRTIALTYDAVGHLLTVTDAMGHVTQRRYEDTGKLASKINALDEETRYEYDANDRLVKVIDANNHATQLGYDAKGRLVSVTNALGNTRQLSYDAGDNLLKRIDALGNTVAALSYDVLDNPLSVSDALGNTSQFEYDAASRLIGSVDPAEKATQFSYDDLGRLVTSVDAAGKSSSQGFDKEGNRTQLTDPNENQTNFVFDKSGRLVKATTAAGGSVQYSYSASDLLKTVINARGQARQFEYDAGGRLTSMTDADGEVTYTYDNNDNVLTVTDANGVISRDYDAVGRVVKYTDSQGNVLQYAYDAGGHLVTLTYPDGKQVFYAYDAADQLVKVTDWANRSTRYTYDANGRLTQVVRPNGTRMTRDYDAAGQLVEQRDVDIDSELIRQFNFVYDAAGNITQEQSLPEAVLVPVRSVVMSYEAANRADTYRSATVVQEKDILLDADGNMTWGLLERGSLDRDWVEFAYDSRNRLVKAGDTVYRYDAENQRIAVQETRYVVNSQPALSQVLMKTAPDGQKTFYVYGLGLIGQEAGGEYQAYHFDLRGSTTALSDVEGEVVERIHYSPYGDVISHHPRLLDVPFLYNGRDGVMTDDSGLLYMRARYYNTDLRRFVNQDVLLGGVAEGQTLNRYAYVTGDPVRFVDPFGLVYIPSGFEKAIGEFVNDITDGAAQFADNVKDGAVQLKEDVANTAEEVWDGTRWAVGEAGEFTVDIAKVMEQNPSAASTTEKKKHNSSEPASKYFFDVALIPYQGIGTYLVRDGELSNDVNLIKGGKVITGWVQGVNLAVSGVIISQAENKKRESIIQTSSLLGGMGSSAICLSVAVGVSSTGIGAPAGACIAIGCGIAGGYIGGKAGEAYYDSDYMTNQRIHNEELRKKHDSLGRNTFEEQFKGETKDWENWFVSDPESATKSLNSIMRGF